MFSKNSVGQRLSPGPIGAATVLVGFPSLAIFFGIEWMSAHPTVGLPVLALFGIMMLFGAMALVSTLFARLKLDNRAEPLALPAGSVRAAIALSLIVLFAIISIMMFQSFTQPYRIPGLSEKAMLSIASEPKNRIVAIRANVTCSAELALAASPPATAASAAPTAPVPSASAGSCYDVHLAQAAPPEAVDIAKQLLVLLGTLVTSVTSFYFASRSSAPDKPNMPPSAAIEEMRAVAQPAAPAAKAASDDDGHGDACGAHVTEALATRDEDLPAATGGVA